MLSPTGLLLGFSWLHDQAHANLPRMGSEEDTWPLPPADVLCDPPAYGFTLGFYRVSPAFLRGGYMAKF